MSSDNGKQSLTENFTSDVDSNEGKWKQYENEALYMLGLHGLSGMKLV